MHAVAYVMEMQGRIDEGIDWLESREQDWALDNGFAFHNWWHLALYYLDRQRYDRVLTLYDRQIYPEPSDMTLQLVDATALLWRLYLQGVDHLGDRFKALADAWESKLDIERGFYAFNDFHAMMAFLGAGRSYAAGQVLKDLEATAGSATGINAMMAREVGLPLCQGVQAFAEGRYEEAIAWIEPVRDIANRVGGSHAQRDILTLTLIEAALRVGRSNLGRHYIAERTVHRPASGLGWCLLARTAIRMPKQVEIETRRAA